MILFVEKLFLRFVAINFHQRALADRLAENRLGLKALDRLSNAHPVATTRKTGHGKKGHKSTLGSLGASLDLGGLTGAWRRKETSNVSTPLTRDVSPGQEEHESTAQHPPQKKKHHGLSRAETRRRRRKFMTSIIVDQVGGAISQVALKNSKYNKDVEMGGLHSARKLAKKLFEGLKATSPERSHLIVEGASLIHPDTRGF